MAVEVNPFDDGQTPVSDFDGLDANPESPTTAARDNPITSRLMAIAESKDGVLALQQEAIENAQARIHAGEEFTSRLTVANARQQRQMASVNKHLAGMGGGITTSESLAETSKIYGALSQQRVEDNAKASFEREAVEKIQDDLSTGNTDEAKIVYNLLTKGTATKQWYDHAARNLVLAQKIQQYRGEADDETWLGKSWNFVAGFIPLNNTFGNAGIVEAEGTGGFKNWLLSGTGLQAQGEAMHHMFNSMTPEEMADALKDGAPIDVALRSNSTTLGGYDPNAAADKLTALNFQSKSDRYAANAWSIADVGLSGVVPWSKLSSIPAGLARIGSRSAARKVVAAAWDDIIENGPKAAEKAGAVTEKEVVENLETSTLNPAASTDHAVTLAEETATRIAAARKMKEQLPELLQVTRATTPEEIAHAYEEGVKRIEAEVGRSVKDVRYKYEDVATGHTYDYSPGSALPEQGNVVHYVEVTFGKKGGGMFASAKSAMSEAINRLGIRGEVGRDITERELNNVEMGFSTRGYHGTSFSFDEFDPRMAGKSTGGENTRGTVRQQVDEWNLSRAEKDFRDPDGYISQERWTKGVKDAARQAEKEGAEIFIRNGGKDVKVNGQLKDSGGKSWGTSALLFPTPGTDDGLRIVRKKADNGVTYLTSDPDVATGYARNAATTHNHAEMARLQAAMKADPTNTALEDEYLNVMENMMDDGGANIRPTDMDTSNYMEVDMSGKMGGSGPIMQAIQDDAKKKGFKGVIFKNFDDDLRGGKVSDIYAVFDPATLRSSLAGPKIVRDVSGGYFVKARFNISEEGFRTTALDTPENGMFSFARSDARRVDSSAQRKAVAAGANADKLQKAITDRLRESVKGINGEDRGRLDEIIRMGQNKSQWANDSQFRALFERLSGGEPPSDRVLGAYKEYQLANDLEYVIRNDEMYKTYAASGHETVTFDLGKTGLKINGTGKVTIGGTKPTERVFNSTDGIHYNSRNPLTAEEFKRLSDEGYVLVTTKEPVGFPDGTKLRQVMMKREELTRAPLSREQLAYKAGGHRMYTGKYFIKQTMRGVQPDTGSSYLLNPNVYRTGNNPNRLRAWADIFNRALDDVANGITDPQHFDDNVFANGKGLSFPKGEEFLREVEAGRINVKDHVEVVGDRELPAAYNEADDRVLRLVDEDESSTGGYFRTTGRLYTSSRGEALTDEFGQLAETVDPWETANTALANISRMSSLSNYKLNVMDRFRNTYGAHLDVRNVERLTDSELIKAKPKNGTSLELKRQINAEQAAVSRILNFETEFEKTANQQASNVARWILGDADGGFREKAHDAFYWLNKNNPVNYIRGLAFDAKLGLFNVGQLFLQSSTMLASTALSPRHGLKGMGGALPMFAYVNAKGAENVLDVLAKNGSWRVAGFGTEQEFKEYARFAYKSGFMDVSNTHLSINDFRPNRVFGASSVIEGIREKGRVFFYSAEILNRSVSTRIAWEELKEQGVQLGSAEFREKFIGLADDYSMNMTHESSAAFQKGLWSIPTQFWGYNVRSMDAMFGKRFTPAQRSRLILSQFALYGAGGVPLIDAFGEYAKTQGGVPIETGTLASYLDRGVMDNAFAALTGADIRIGEKLGTGQFLTDTLKKTGAAEIINNISNPIIGDIFTINSFDEQSIAETAGGATFSIATSAIGTGKDVIASVYDYARAESGNDQGFPILKENILKMADNISTVSNVHKALLVNQYGIYRSNGGSIQASGLPSQDAFFVALGMRPQEVDNMAVMQQFTKNREDVVKEAAKVVRNWRQEAFTIPDKYEENQKKVNFYVSLLPPAIRKQVLNQTNVDSASLYEYIQKKYDQEKVKADGELNSPTG
jgi:hypothetical protein